MHDRRSQRKSNDLNIRFAGWEEWTPHRFQARFRAGRRTAKQKLQAQVRECVWTLLRCLSDPASRAHPESRAALRDAALQLIDDHLGRSDRRLFWYGFVRAWFCDMRADAIIFALQEGKVEVARELLHNRT